MSWNELSFLLSLRIARIPSAPPAIRSAFLFL
jgi:hypothetical protein